MSLVEKFKEELRQLIWWAQVWGRRGFGVTEVGQTDGQGATEQLQKSIETEYVRAHESATLERKEKERLTAAIRNHRDQRGDDRCWLDDRELYAALPEGTQLPLNVLPPEPEFLANCARFHASRQPGGQEYVSSQQRIEELEAELAERTRERDDMKATIDASAVEWAIKLRVQELAQELENANLIAKKRSRVVQWLLKKRIPFIKRQRDEARAAAGLPWPPREVVLKLIEAGHHLLHDHDCDQHGHELVKIALDEAEKHAVSAGWKPNAGGKP